MSSFSTAGYITPGPPTSVTFGACVRPTSAATSGGTQPRQTTNTGAPFAAAREAPARASGKSSPVAQKWPAGGDVGNASRLTAALVSKREGPARRVTGARAAH